MTDKQIIIDGVDVSGCPHYIHKDGSCSSQDCECIKCVHNACFYKDYKTKEQECKELKRQYKELGQCSKRLQKKRLNVLQMVKLLHAHKLNKSYKKSVNVRQKINEN